MNESHIPAVAQIERESFSDPWSENLLLSECANENARFYVALWEDRVIGYFGMQYIIQSVPVNVCNQKIKSRSNRNVCIWQSSIGTVVI